MTQIGEVVVSGTITILSKTFPVEATTIGKAKRQAAHWYKEKFGEEFQEKFGEECLISNLTSMAVWTNQNKKTP